MERILRWSIIVASILLSLGWILFAALVTGAAAEAGRGGAISVALTLFVYIVRREIIGDVRHAIEKKLPAIDAALAALGESPQPPPNAAKPEAATPTLDSLDRRLRALASAISINAVSERRIDRAVAAAAAISTLSWGFGDLAAEALQQALT